VKQKNARKEQKQPARDMKLEKYPEDLKTGGTM